MIATWNFPITHADAWGLVALAVFATIAIRASRFRLPDPTLLQNYATLTNTKGGIIILLIIMWWGTLLLTIAICLWVIVRGVDPQNGVLVVLLSMLTSGAWGNVNGALFKTMTGEDPKPPTTSITEVKESKAPLP